MITTDSAKSILDTCLVDGYRVAMPKNDWIGTMNDLVDKFKHDDRMLVEHMMVFLQNKKLGDAFVKFYEAEGPKGLGIGD